MKTICKTTLLLAFAAILWSTQPAVHGQAFCSLRDPNRIIGQLFPGFTQFKSITATVKASDVAELESLTGLKCDPREFGRHQLYAVFKGDDLIGFAQSRSELVDWGIAEIIVATDADGAFKGFRFQRCRSSHRKKVEAENVQKLMAGKLENDFIALVGDKNVADFRTKAGLSSRATPLLRGVVLGIAKMQALMRTVWKDDIAQLKTGTRGGAS